MKKNTKKKTTKTKATPPFNPDECQYCHVNYDIHTDPDSLCKQLHIAESFLFAISTKMKTPDVAALYFKRFPSDRCISLHFPHFAPP